MHAKASGKNALFLMHNTHRHTPATVNKVKQWLAIPAPWHNRAGWQIRGCYTWMQYFINGGIVDICRGLPYNQGCHNIHCDMILSDIDLLFLLFFFSLSCPFLFDIHNEILQSFLLCWTILIFCLFLYPSYHLMFNIFVSRKFTMFIVCRTVKRY